MGGVFHLQKISGNFGGNFHRVKNVFHLTQVRSPPSDCDFTRQKFKNVAVNSLEVVRPFKSCKWNTHFHRKVSNGKTGLPFQKFRLFRKFSSGTNQKRVFHLHPNRNFLVNGKRPGLFKRNDSTEAERNENLISIDLISKIVTNSNPLGIKRFVPGISISFKYERYIIMQMKEE